MGKERREQMKGLMLGMLAETSIHPGSGQVYSVIDLPVARESTTNYPMIAGSSLKGSLRNKVETEWKEEEKIKINEIFGTGDGIGGVSISDARLLLLPVRSLIGHFRWVTCPNIIERFVRDLQMIGKKFVLPDFPNRMKSESLVATVEDHVFLEELSYETTRDEEIIRQVKELVAQVIPIPFLIERLEKQLVILSDDEFAYFAKFGLPIHARNSLDSNTKKSEGLWYEETLPPDTVMYSVFISRPGNEGVLDELCKNLTEQPYIQVGGNETVGQGWFFTKIVN
jgi:CRISPR-associated protein Cmr4